MLPGTNWWLEINENIQLATDAIGIVTDSAAASPWFNFELGALSVRLARIPLLTVGTELAASHPLAHYQRIRSSNFNVVVEFATALSDDVQTKQLLKNELTRIDEQWRQFVDSLLRPEHKSPRRELTSAIARISATVANSRLISELQANSCLREIACKSLDDVAHSLTAIPQSNGVVLERHRYPDYLLHLQSPSGLRCRVQAIAVVDRVEEFWSKSLGNEISETARPDSARIFVFQNSESLKRHFDAVYRHGLRYATYVASTLQFGLVCSERNIHSDFSIFSDPKSNNQVLATYDELGENIIFSADEAAIRSHREAFELLARRLNRIEPPRVPIRGFVDESFRVQLDQYRDRVIAHVFPVSQQRVMHSDVIDISRYDLFEEDHPFLREMHETMVAEMLIRLPRDVDGCRILEIGAGTGHFTKRLAQQSIPGLQVVALEIDNRAAMMMERKFAPLGDRVKVLIANAITYDPEGKFRFVFSAFAEHHVAPIDKPRYFENIRSKLTNDGFMIIGDEFLPPHDASKREEYERALKRYHEYILGEAVTAVEFQELEKAAWKSGLSTDDDRVDFKVSLENYKKLVTDAGMEVITEKCVSDVRRVNEVGGMFVLVLKVSQ